MKHTLPLARVAMLLASAATAFVVLPQKMLLPDPAKVRAPIYNVMQPPPGCSTEK